MSPFFGASPISLLLGAAESFTCASGIHVPRLAHERSQSMHEPIHREFSEGLVAEMDEPALTDLELSTTLELILRKDGSIPRLALVDSSGSTAFDEAAFASVMHAQPFAEPPNSVLSTDGQLYVHWSFHRGQMQCGVFNTKVFILSNPRNTASSGRLEPDVVVSEGTPEVPWKF